jgi:hypothetical protein
VRVAVMAVSVIFFLGRLVHHRAISVVLDLSMRAKHVV